MRLVFADLIVGAAAAASPQGPLFAQAVPPDIRPATPAPHSTNQLAARLSVSFANVPLARALSIISERSDVPLTYSSDDLPPKVFVSLPDTNLTVGAALSVVLASTYLHPVAMPGGSVVLTTRGFQRDTSRDSTGTVTGALVGRDDGQEVQYGTVLLVETGEARFADLTGHFRIAHLSPGTYTLRARQIGYARKDTAIRVDSGPAVTTVTIRMVRLPPLLTLVKVKGSRAKDCVATGVPDSIADPILAAIFTQVRENVDRFRLLLDQYPFRYTRQEHMALRSYPGGDSTEFVDTVAYESRARHPYHVGGIIFVDNGNYTLKEILPRKVVPAQQQIAEQSPSLSVTSSTARSIDVKTGAIGIGMPKPPPKVARDSLGDSSYVVKYNRRYMYIPGFRDLADSVFLSAHCFAYGGTKSLGGGDAAELIRVDFRPASAISDPDVEGSVYLDADHFVVRRAVFRMTKPDAADPPVLGLSVTTTFRELLPLVPVFDSVNSQQPFRDVFSGRGSVRRVQVEDDRLLSFAFEGQTPGEQPAVQMQSAPASVVGAPAIPANQDVSSPAGRNETVRPTAERPDSTVVVTGRVIRTDSTPVRGAAVGMLASDDSTATDDGGRFVLRHVRPGAHLLWVHGVGIEPARVAVTLTANRSRAVTITVSPALHTLAEIVTTARVPSAYADIGLDKRMQTGLGQFLTYDQIQQRQATKLSELLKGMRGIQVRQFPRNFEASVQGTRPNGLDYVGCVSFVVDGSPQGLLNAQTASGTHLPQADADNLINPSGIGAIEVYSTSERPSGFEAGSQQCVLVLVWTLARLGLPEDANSAAHSSATRAARIGSPRTTGAAVFPTGPSASCVPPAAIDTTVANVRAVLQSGLPSGAGDTVWTSYRARVLAAIRQTFALPTQLELPVFGYAFPASTRSESEPNSPAVIPTLSSLVVFTLGPKGALLESHVGASSLSGAADTSVLAAIEGAFEGRAFPPIPATRPTRTSVRFDLLVTTITPDSTEPAAILDQVEVPVFPLTRSTQLLAGSLAALEPKATGTVADSAMFELVVDEYGRPIMPTVRAIRQTPASSTDENYRELVARIARLIPDFRFKPALVGSCPVRQVLLQSFAG